jgi:DNA-binding response OmpR family regulator
MTKPFDMHELIYKLRAITRRLVAHRTSYRIGDIILDMEANEISCEGRTRVLQPSQARFLKELYCIYVEQRYESPSYELPYRYTDSQAEDPARVHTLAARLRKNLSDLGSTNVMIESVYGKGYRLIIFPEG